jgi:hypothetical protein
MDVVFKIRFLDAFHLALISHSVYFYLVTDYANPLELTHVVWSFHVSPLIPQPYQLAMIDEDHTVTACYQRAYTNVCLARHIDCDSLFIILQIVTVLTAQA